MKKFQQLLMLFAVASLTIFMSCGPDPSTDDDVTPDGDKTAGAILIETLTGSWSLDASSDVSAVTGAPDITGLSVTFTASGSTVSFALGGSSDVTTYISGGSFDVSDAGAISNVQASAQAAQTDITVSSATASMNSDNTKVTITITVGEAAARTTGIGTYTLVFAKA